MACPGDPERVVDPAACYACEVRHLGGLHGKCFVCASEQYLRAAPEAMP